MMRNVRYPNIGHIRCLSRWCLAYILVSYLFQIPQTRIMLIQLLFDSHTISDSLGILGFEFKFLETHFYY